jgi:hypothetical protein
MKLLATDGSKGETVGGDMFTFSDAGEHVVIFTALTALIATGPQPKGDTEVSKYITVHDAGVSGAPAIELQDATQVGVLVRATDAFATGIAIALVFD